jgi:hypothetical protein
MEYILKCLEVQNVAEISMSTHSFARIDCAVVVHEHPVFTDASESAGSSNLALCPSQHIINLAHLDVGAVQGEPHFEDVLQEFQPRRIAYREWVLDEICRSVVEWIEGYVGESRIHQTPKSLTARCGRGFSDYTDDGWIDTVMSKCFHSSHRAIKRTVAGDIDPLTIVVFASPINTNSNLEIMLDKESSPIIVNQSCICLDSVQPMFARMNTLKTHCFSKKRQSSQSWFSAQPVHAKH